MSPKPLLLKPSRKPTSAAPPERTSLPAVSTTSWISETEGAGLKSFSGDLKRRKAALPMIPRKKSLGPKAFVYKIQPSKAIYSAGKPMNLFSLHKVRALKYS